MALKHNSYEEACDDIYKDLLEELALVRDEVFNEPDEIRAEGIDIALDVIKRKRLELYG